MLNKSWLAMVLMCCAATFAPAAAATEDKEVKNRVSFQVDAGRDVENDWLVAVLNVTAEDKQPAIVADTINKTMTWALQQAKGSDKVKVRGGSYQTYPVYDDRKIVRWRGQQELYLESGAVNELTQLIGVLQSRMQMQSLQFSVSPEVRSRVEEQLVEQVLAAWQKRADVIARALDSKGYELLDVAIHTGGGPVFPARVEAMSMKARADVSAPALESGTSRLTVQASGSIRLLRNQ
ncbi:MAG: SIMPL domain-containing protein [Thiogranum sp.]|nr:SIMPL domain-containing protein [Thiogranum sp.]